MAWGSNISEVRFNAPVIEFDPATWSQIGQRKREEDRKTKATESVAMARKSVRDKFQTDRENKAYLQNKEALAEALKKAEAELAEINKQIQTMQAEEKQAIEQNQSMVANPSMVSNTTDQSARVPNRSFASAPSEIPIFQKWNR